MTPEEYFEEVTMGQMETYVKQTVGFIGDLRGLLENRDNEDNDKTLDLIHMTMYEYLFTVSEIFGIDPLEGKV